MEHRARGRRARPRVLAKPTEQHISFPNNTHSCREERIGMEQGAREGKEGREVSGQPGCQEMKTSDVCEGVSVCFLQSPFCFIV